MRKGENPMRKTTFAGLLVLIASGMVGPVAAEPPVGWRNDGSGAFPTAKPPSEWSSEKNVLWKVTLPGNSYGTPVVVGDNLYVVSDPAELLCISRKDGSIVWKKSFSDVKGAAVGGYGPGGGFGPGGGRGPGGGPGGGRGPGGPGGPGGFGGPGGITATNTAATPVSDGKHIGLVSGNGVVAVYTADGKRLWCRLVEGPRIMFGHAASPVLLQDKLIVHIEDMVALDVETGKEVWRVKLPAAHASPVAAKVGKEDVVISPAGSVVRVKDGEVLAKGKFKETQSSPVVQGDTIYIFGKTLEAYKLTCNDDGKVTITSLWSHDGAREMHHLPSPLIHDGLVYGVTTGGFLDVLDAKDGTSVYRERLGMSQVYSSVTLAGDLLYVLDTRGKAVVFKPGKKFERVSKNDLDEGTGACPVFADDSLYLRGQKHLFCIGTKEK
jgi:outer membrane protein assembly factor BamB